MSASPLTVRPARAEDLDSVARMGAALVRLHHDWDEDRFFLPKGIEQGYRTYFASQLSVRETVILVAERDERVIGYTYASLIPRDWSDLREACGKVHDLYVEEPARSTGAGSALLSATVSRLKELGVPRIVLMVAAQNDHARAVFERVGFRETMIEMTLEANAEPGAVRAV